jgi:hypothetical protein
MARPTSAVPSSPSDKPSDSLIAGSRGAHVPETVEWMRNAAATAARGDLSTAQIMTRMGAGLYDAVLCVSPT